MQNTTSKIWEKIVELLRERNLTISTMESCTGGGIANLITDISGASSVLQESYVTYCNSAKIKQGVSAKIIEQYTVYSPETAIEMAKNAKKNAKSDYGVGVTGQLGRIDPCNPVDKLNHVWYAIITSKNEIIIQEVKVIDAKRAYQKKQVINDIALTLLELLSNTR